MARARRKPSKKIESDENGAASDSSNTVDKGAETKGRVRLMGLTADEIRTLMGKTRQKGIYVLKLNEFLESGESGISVKETWIEFKDKKDSTLKQGFDNAKDNKEAHEGSDKVKVISNEGNVFLINLVAAEELDEAVA